MECDDRGGRHLAVFLAGERVVVQVGGQHPGGDTGLVLHPSPLVALWCPLLRDHNCYLVPTNVKKQALLITAFWVIFH